MGVNGNGIQIAGMVLSAPVVWEVLKVLWRRLRHDPLAEAEARKFNAQADQIEWSTLRGEIDRLSETVKRQGARIQELEQRDAKRSKREHELESENNRLRLEVASLRRRVAQLEEIIKTKTTPEDMRAQLAEIDRLTPDSKK